MLYIVFDSSQPEKEWHVGQNLNLDKEEIFHVVMVQADGRELQLVLSQVLGLNPRKHVVQFFGDQAKWIVANIVMSS